MLVGVDNNDLGVLVRDFAVRWLAARPLAKEENRTGARARLVILCPCRNASAVGVVRALADAGIAVEDELGEVPEPSLAIQIQRAILDYHQDGAGLESLLALVELLNEYTAVWETVGGGTLRRVFPLDPVEARRALHGAFADVQHHNVRVLTEAAGFLRAEIARPLRDLIAHLGEWPETIRWMAALRRWEECLNGFGLTTEVLEPLWSRLAELQMGEPVPSAAFFQYLGRVLAGGVPAQRAAGAAHRFARVVVTTLEGATGQTWGGVLFLDSNEGAWPIYTPENPFLDDAARGRLNEANGGDEAAATERAQHRLLTSSDHAQLEHFRFLEVLENCHGPLAFGGVSRDPAELTKEFYPNEWALRCLVEGGHVAAEGEKLMDRWRRATRRTARVLPKLGKRDAAHLHEVFVRRRDPEAGFDEYFFNFDALANRDELPFGEDYWSARDLENAWARPATFALSAMFGVEPWRGRRARVGARRRLDDRTARASLAARGVARIEGAEAVERGRLAARPDQRARASPRGNRNAVARGVGGRPDCGARGGRRRVAFVVAGRVGQSRLGLAPLPGNARDGGGWRDGRATLALPGQGVPCGVDHPRRESYGCGRSATCCCSTGRTSPGRPARSSTCVPARRRARAQLRPRSSNGARDWERRRPFFSRSRRARPGKVRTPAWSIRTRRWWR